jgi:hypothetical protein
MHQRMPLVPSACDQYYLHHEDNEEPPYYDCAAFDRFVLHPIADGLEAMEAHNGALVAFGTLVIASFTGTLWWVTWGMVRIAREQRVDTVRAIEAAEQANSISREHLIAGERPWVSVSLSAASTATVMPNHTLRLEIQFNFKNHGNSPALGIKYHVAMVDAESVDIIIIHESTQKIIVEADADLSPTGFTLFPTEEAVRRQWLGTWNDPRVKVPTRSPDLDDFIQGFLVGFVAYSFMNGGVGYTRFTYQLAKHSPYAGPTANGSHTLHILNVGWGISKHETEISMEEIIFHRIAIGEAAT